MKLQGIKPKGTGETLEVHIDLYRTNPAFTMWLESLGFENDPFTVFHPQGYTHHMTGRVRTSKNSLLSVLEEIESLVSEVIGSAKSRELDLYTEVELVREVIHLEPQSLMTSLTMLDELCFSSSGRLGGAKADVHVEFPQGSVGEEVHAFLLEKKFYWVETPRTPYFEAEEIATLQTATFGSAKKVYDLLRTNPLPGCTGVVLEQKLNMDATRSDLSMPEVIAVKGAS